MINGQGSRVPIANLWTTGNLESGCGWPGLDAQHYGALHILGAHSPLLYSATSFSTVTPERQQWKGPKKFGILCTALPIRHVRPILLCNERDHTVRVIEDWWKPCFYSGQIHRRFFSPSLSLQRLKVLIIVNGSTILQDRSTDALQRKILDFSLPLRQLRFS